MSNPKSSLLAQRRAMGARPRQRGVTLIELLVGLTIGLMVIAAAIGTMILSRTTASSVSDLSELQQQAAFALRAIGTQVRQAGSIRLIKPTGQDQFFFDSAFTGFNDGGLIVTGTEGAEGTAPDTVSFSSQPAPAGSGEVRDCLGQSAPTAARMDSTFSVTAGSLRCLGATASPVQPLIDNVADFQVLYRVRTSDTAVQRMKADAVEAAALWGSVQAIEVCLDLQGDESSNPASGNYTNCNDTATARNGRVHLVFRNVFEIRTRGA